MGKRIKRDEGHRKKKGNSSSHALARETFIKEEGGEMFLGYGL